MDILELADNLRNHTESNSYTNPIDVDTVIDLLKMLISTQSQVQFLNSVLRPIQKFVSYKNGHPVL